MTSESDENEFSMRHVFERVNLMDLGVIYSGNEENHFGYNWTLNMVWKNELDPTDFIDLKCQKTSEKDGSSIDVTIDSLLLNKMGMSVQNYKFSANTCEKVTLLKMLWTDQKKFLVDDKLEVEIRVKVNGDIGNPKKLRNFDESTKEFSDVVLKVADEKFYVLKLFLASHSTYFQSLFCGNFEESGKSEVELKDIEPRDFQNFLELINGESLVNNYTVDGLLHLADFFDSKTVFRRCEQFLMEEKSQKSIQRKFGLAVKYNIDKLKKKCVSEMKTTNDIRAVLPEVSDHTDYVLWKELLMKTLSFSN